MDIYESLPFDFAQPCLPAGRGGEPVEPCSPGFVRKDSIGELTEQIARQIFEVLSSTGHLSVERGPVIVIMDSEGNNWPSDPEEFARLNISESFLKEVCAKIDDGAEPVVTEVNPPRRVNDCSVIAAQLATEHSNCGYVIIALPQYSPESTLVNIDLIEMLLNQIGLIAKLIEKNNLLYEVFLGSPYGQMKHYRLCGQSEIALN